MHNISYSGRGLEKKSKFYLDPRDTNGPVLIIKPKDLKLVKQNKQESEKSKIRVQALRNFYDRRSYRISDATKKNMAKFIV